MVAQEALLLEGVDAFGHDARAEAVADPDHRLHDAGGGRVLVDVAAGQLGA